MMISAGWWLQILGAFQPDVEYYATMSFTFPICWVKDVQEFFENKKISHTNRKSWNTPNVSLKYMKISKYSSTKNLGKP